MPLGFRKSNVEAALILCLFFNSSSAQSWVQLDDFPAAERDDGLAFVIGDTAYCGTGLQVGWSETKDFHAFNMDARRWFPVSPLPIGEKRQYAAGFTVRGKGLVFGGVNAGQFLNNLWEYNPLSNTWQSKASLPSIGRSGSASFVINNTAYVIGGKTDSSEAINEVWAYDIANDTWQQKSDLPVDGLYRACASAESDKGYLLFGKNAQDDFNNSLFEYDPQDDQWTIISSFPGLGRTHASLNTMGGKLLVMGGIDSSNTYYNDIWAFGMEQLQWIEMDSLPSFGRKGGISFNNGSNLFYTTGINQENQRLKETWQYINPLNLQSSQAFNATIHPNPSEGRVTITVPSYKANEAYRVCLLNTFGKVVMVKTLNKSESPLNLESLPAGIYFIRIQNKQDLLCKKFLKL